MNFKRLKLMRAAARVKRHHTGYVHHEQTVGEHTFGVLCLIHDIIDPRKPSPQLIKAALYHDVHEAVRGDPPAPALWKDSLLKERYELIDMGIDESFELTAGDVEPWEEQVLRFCDSMEYVIFALEEVATGNVIMMPRARGSLASIRRRGREKCTPAAEALTMLMEQRAAEYPDKLGEEETHVWPG